MKPLSYNRIRNNLMIKQLVESDWLLKRNEFIPKRIHVFYTKMIHKKVVLEDSSIMDF